MTVHRLKIPAIMVGSSTRPKYWDEMEGKTTAIGGVRDGHFIIAFDDEEIFITAGEYLRIQDKREAYHKEERHPDAEPLTREEVKNWRAANTRATFEKLRLRADTDDNPTRINRHLRG